MSYLIQKDYVRYECSCGSLKTIVNLYFCRYCLEFRCGSCLSHEVDIPYCSNCLENMPTQEAKVKNNRCSNCYDCPSCGHTLNIRAVAKSAPTDAGGGDTPSKVPTKHFYLFCFFCRWTTRDVGIPDQTVASGNWPTLANPHLELLTSYLEHYRLLVHAEKKSLTGRKVAPGARYSSYTDKYGVTAAMARKRAGLPSLNLSGAGASPREKAPSRPFEPCKASESVEPLPEHLFTQPPDLNELTRLEVRLANPVIQAEKREALHPILRHFYVKRSLRCKKCEHNLSKPEYNPTSIKFKLKLTAYYHVVEFKIAHIEGQLVQGSETGVVIKLTNPTQHMTSVSIVPIAPGQPVGAKSNSGQKVNCSVSEISSTILLPPKDDAAEYDDTPDIRSMENDPEAVIWRKGNKAKVRLLVKPEDVEATCSIIGLAVEYAYVNAKAGQNAQSRTEVPVNVYLTLPSTM